MNNTARQYSESSKSTQQLQTVLLVDDDRTLRAVLGLQLEQMGYAVIEAANGREALDILQQSSEEIDIILLDREMPVMDGMEFIAQQKADARFAKMPVIMATGSGQPDQISQGIEAGVFYYLVKPVNYDVLSTLVSTAMREAQRTKKMATVLQKQKDSFSLLTEAEFTITTLTEAENLATMLANSYDDPQRVYPGLFALMSNGIEHGNLGIGLEEKARLLSQGKLSDEINRRLSSTQYRDKELTVTYQKTSDQQMVTITDQGNGFDWRAFWNIDPGRVFQGNGRGIALARTQSFDMLTYNDVGNSVMATLYTTPQAA